MTPNSGENFITISCDGSVSEGGLEVVPNYDWEEHPRDQLNDFWSIKNHTLGYDSEKSVIFVLSSEGNMAYRLPEGGDAYPQPDRSNYNPTTVKSAENDVIDIGWNEGVLSDGRRYRAECWADSQITMLTFFFSIQGMESNTDAMLGDLLTDEGLVQFLGEKRYVATTPIVDAANNKMWSVNVVVGDDDNTFIADSLKLQPYPKG